MDKQRKASRGGKTSPRQGTMTQRDEESWRKTDGVKEGGREIEGSQMELRSETCDSPWEEYRWGTLVLIGACVFDSFTMLDG